MSIKIPVTPSGNEPATFRLVAQCLNRLRHQQRAPFVSNTRYKYQIGLCVLVFFLWRFDQIPGHGLPWRSFAVTLIGHITLGRTPLDE